MLLSDEKIEALIESGVLTNAESKNVRSVPCDLMTDAFYID